MKSQARPLEPSVLCFILLSTENIHPIFHIHFAFSLFSSGFVKAIAVLQITFGKEIYTAVCIFKRPFFFSLVSVGNALGVYISKT